MHWRDLSFQTVKCAAPDAPPVASCLALDPGQALSLLLFPLILQLLTKNRGLVDALVERLEDVKTIQKDELASIVSMYGEYDEAPPPLEDVQGEIKRLRQAYTSSQG